MSASDPTTRLNTALEGRYRIERELGEGGMATVYLADDLKHERKVALKVLKPELAVVVGAERFLAEIKTTANLQHPHILPLFDSGEADSFLFYVMPYVEGETLRDRLDREKQLPVDEALTIATAIANALQTAHDNGVIHRDIKPGNILLSRGEPLVADFGIALAVGCGRRKSPHRDGIECRHAVLHEPRTGDRGSGGGPRERYVLLGRRALRDAHRRPALRRQHGAGGARQDHSGCARVRDRHQEVDPPERGRGHEEGPGEASPPTGSRVRRTSPKRSPIRRSVMGNWPPPRSASALGSAGQSCRRASLSGSPSCCSGPRSVPEPARRVGRFAIATEDGTAFRGLASILPDGSGMIYLAPGGSGQNMLWIRRWNEAAGTPVRGSEGASDVRPSVSPDGLEVAFSAGFPGPLRVASLLGGAVRTIADAAYGGGVWTADGETVYFCDVGVGISRISANGGEATQVMAHPDSNYVPISLLDGDDVLLLRRYLGVQTDQSHVQALRLATGEATTLVAGSSPATVTPSGQAGVRDGGRSDHGGPVRRQSPRCHRRPSGHRRGRGHQRTDARSRDGVGRRIVALLARELPREDIAGVGGSRRNLQSHRSRLAVGRQPDGLESLSLTGRQQAGARGFR